MTQARYILSAALLAAAALLGTGLAHAEKADRQKPMNVEADALRFDDAKQTSQFTGNVVVTQGSLIMRADRMDVRQDAQGQQFGVAYGSAAKRAFFRQKRDNVDEYIEGEANRLEYDSKNAEMRLIGNAEMRRYIGAKLSDTTDGQRIVYRTDTEVFTVDGSPAANGKAGSRVRATLSPRSSGEAAPGAAPPATPPKPAPAAQPGTPLRGSTTLEEPRP
ncbi:MAG: Lipopolysaccharide export system protein LptA [Paracidovorax wautersii]|uniref:Lipopolysaccharide export system protein LptA n=1 Tax=Paracidovorax wautersii TaxID=1177982 RepID=A0A7V8FP43_9BURK|nr:MAG: Lipopolysaccharide export system protein LptA [Paracidovorax wautersii]